MVRFVQGGVVKTFRYVPQLYSMSHSMPEDTDAIVRSLAKFYAMQGRKREVALLAQSQADMEEVNYDNWNGGTYTYDLNLRAPAALYAALEDDVEKLEQEFLDRLTPLSEADERRFGR